MAGPRRNDPCPCGSGKKAKKCCFGSDGGVPIMPLDPHRRKNLDLRDAVLDRLLKTMVRWTREEDSYATAVKQALSAMPFSPDDPASVELGLPWLAHCVLLEGRTLATRYLAEAAPRTLEQVAWLEAEAESWLGVWEVEAVHPGDALELHDRLTGQRRRVLDRLGSSTISVRSGLLARVVEHDGAAWFSGLHPQGLPPRALEAVVATALDRLGTKGPVEPSRLRSGEATFHLLRAWAEEVDRVLAKPLPELRNTDGEPLLLTKDRFTLEPKDRPAVREALLGLEGCELAGAPPSAVGPPDVEVEDCERFVLLGESAGAGPEGGRTHLALVELFEDRLVLDTNSVARADRYRSRLEAATGGLLHHRMREHQDPSSLLGRRAQPSMEPEDDAPLPEEASRYLRELKERHYATWPDHPLPALSGLTPRQAASRPKERPKLDLLLRELEYGESSLPVDQRFDVGVLRRELGLD